MSVQKPAVSARSVAYFSLLRCEQNGRYANLELDSALRTYPLEGAERALYTILTYGVTERTLTLDALLSQVCDRALATMDPRVRCVLRLGAYQLWYLDRIPSHAAVDECVKLCKKHGFAKAAPFVNAVLRAFLRKKDAFLMPNRDTDPVGYLQFTYSFPAWICALFCRQYGFSRTEEILRAQNEHPYLTLHVNTLKTSRAALLARLAAEGISAEACTEVPEAIRLCAPVAIPDLSPLAEGLCFVQDLSSQLAAQAVDAHAGDTVIDTCACPGGKSFAIALQMQNQGTLYSMDLHANKLSLIRSGAERLGITCIQTQTQDGCVCHPAFHKIADRVLCDVPCSGLGVMAKKPDLRYKTETEIARLPKIQAAILQNAAGYLKDGGKLVYSTCTLHQAENEDVVHAFLQQNPDFSLCEMQTIFPTMRGNDGFFFAVLTRAAHTTSVSS